jgi:hypothetical protein
MPSRQSLLDLHDIAGYHRAFADKLRADGNLDDAETQDRVAALVEGAISRCVEELHQTAPSRDARSPHALSPL